MLVIPSINVKNFRDFNKRLKEAEALGAKWAHVDVTDGKFTKTKLWNNSRELKVKSLKLKVNLEAHLMVKNPDAVLGDWLKAGIKRIIVHVESAKNIPAMAKKCRAKKAELALALKPDTPIEKVLPYRNFIKQVLVLSVVPGPAGQKFQKSQLRKIQSLRQKMPSVKIEVDGGINLATAKLCKRAGADILVSAAYLFNSPNPRQAYKTLRKI
ncbi:MAG: ribulose-phosphate 3-epimerase [bacterium]|nr:ribulose-phosphate 3-epimerase [bacterium]